MGILDKPQHKSLFRVTVLHHRLARSWEQPVHSRPGGRVPTFDELLDFLRRAFGFPLGNHCVDTVEYSPSWLFPDAPWIEWSHYDPLPLPSHTEGDRTLLGGNIKTAKEWNALFRGRAGVWGGVHLRGHLILTVRSLQAAEHDSAIQSWADKPSLPDAAWFLDFGVLTPLRSRIVPAVSSADIQPTLQLLEIESFEATESFSNRPVKRYRCVLSDGVNSTSVLIHASFNLEFVQFRPLDIVKLEEFWFADGRLICGRMEPVGRAGGIGSPSPFRLPVDSPRVPSNATKVLLSPDILGAFFTLLSEACQLGAGSTKEIRGRLGLLYRCSLVCVTWRTICTPHLYRHPVFVSSSASDQDPRNLWLALHPRAHLVHTLDLDLTAPSLQRRIFLDGTLHFPSLTTVRRLCLQRGPFDLAVIAPALRDLEFVWSIPDDADDELKLPEMLEMLEVQIVQAPRTCMERLSTSNLAPLRHLEIDNLEGNSLLFDVSDFERLISRSHVGPNLCHLGLSQPGRDDDGGPTPFKLLPPCPTIVLVACPHLETLAIFGLRLEAILREGSTSIQQIDIFLSGRAERVYGPERLTLGQEMLYVKDAEVVDPEVVGEIIDHFSRDRWPLLTRVRLTLADWEVVAHRTLVGMKELVGALRLLGIELVDRKGRLWWGDDDQ